MKQILQGIQEAENSGKKLLAVLIDPEKFDPATASEFLRKMPLSTTHILIGGSTVSSEENHAATTAIKAETDLPIILFPGDYRQISEAADAIFFLSLLSGRNPEYLIGQQVESVPFLQDSNLEIIPTGYILIDGGNECAVQRVSQTRSLSQEEPGVIVNTALAGKYSGKQLIYLEAGSGAETPICPQIITAVKQAVKLPIIVGGGIRSKQQLEAAYKAGADMVVVGTAFENGEFFIN